MAHKSQGKRIKKDKNKEVIKNNVDYEDLKIFFRVLSKRYVLAPIVFMILYMLDHPNQEITKIVHDLLKLLVVP